ncbi:MAG: efflux transporter periplasmic adaptor subunit, partial [Giesbergeria sp.]|nr:efflux transporter periplasmic adaptor subunit [Giesbergeria sp.]
MASRALYLVVAVIGMAGAGTAAWWLQKPGAAVPQNAAPAVARNAQRAGAAKPISVEVAHVRAMAISDEVQAVGSLRSRRSV